MAREQADLVIFGYVLPEDVSNEEREEAEIWLKRQNQVGLGVEAALTFQRAEDPEYEDPHLTREEMYARAGALASMAAMLPEVSEELRRLYRQRERELTGSAS